MKINVEIEIEINGKYCKQREMMNDDFCDYLYLEQHSHDIPDEYYCTLFKKLLDSLGSISEKNLKLLRCKQCILAEKKSDIDYG